MLYEVITAGFTATTNELQAVFFDAVQQYNDARRRITLYQKQQLTATQSLNILTQRFSATQSGLTDLLQAQRQLLDFQLKLTEAIADNNTAIARLKLLMSQVHRITSYNVCYTKLLRKTYPIAAIRFMWHGG